MTCLSRFLDLHSSLSCGPGVVKYASYSFISQDDVGAFAHQCWFDAQIARTERDGETKGGTVAMSPRVQVWHRSNAVQTVEVDNSRKESDLATWMSKESYSPHCVYSPQISSTSRPALHSARYRPILHSYYVELRSSIMNGFGRSSYAIYQPSPALMSCCPSVYVRACSSPRHTRMEI